MLMDNVFAYPNDALSGLPSAKARTAKKKAPEPPPTFPDFGIRQILEDELNLTGVTDVEIKELVNFISHGCTNDIGADLTSYCHAMTGDNYTATTNRIIRHLVDAINEIWANEENQEKLFPDWFSNRHNLRDMNFNLAVDRTKRSYVPSNVAVTYQLYNMVAQKLGANPEHWRRLSGNYEPPRLVPLNVA